MSTYRNMDWKLAVARFFRHCGLDPRGEVHAPLLNTADIHDLFQRALAIKSQAEAAREIALPQRGDTRAVQRGIGFDYEESRLYQMGDEPRFIHWRLYARTGDPYAKIFREERRPGVFILLDRRVAMRFGTRVRLKAAQAARVAIFMAAVAGFRNLKLGGVLMQKDPIWLTAMHGQTGAFALAEAATQACPPERIKMTEPTLDVVLRTLQATLPRGTTVYLISDFRDLDVAAPALWMQLGLEHKVHAVHIMDPAELNLPPAGPLWLRSGLHETGRMVDTSNPATLRAYHVAATEFLNATQALFRLADIPYVRLTPDLEAIERVIPLP